MNYHVGQVPPPVKCSDFEKAKWIAVGAIGFATASVLLDGTLLGTAITAKARRAEARKKSRVLKPAKRFGGGPRR